MNYGRTTRTASGAVLGLILAASFVYGIAAGEGLKATPEHFEFGTVDEGTPAVATTTIHNTGTTTVEITNVRTN